MKLEDDYAIKFYSMYHRISPVSTNYGVVGSKKKFDAYVKQLLKLYKEESKKDKTIKIYYNNAKLTIIQNDVEMSYVHIQDSDDITNFYFRKLI